MAIARRNKSPTLVCECSLQCLSCYLLGYFSFSSRVKTDLNFGLISEIDHNAYVVVFLYAILC